MIDREGLLAVCDMEVMAPLSGFSMRRLKILKDWTAWRAASRPPKGSDLGNTRGPQGTTWPIDIQSPLYH